jgi:hypothetical protein
MPSQQTFQVWWTAGCAVGEETIKVNGKVSVEYRGQKMGPTKSNNRLDNKKTDLTLPNGREVSVVVRGWTTFGTAERLRELVVSRSDDQDVIYFKTPQDRVFVYPSAVNYDKTTEDPPTMVVEPHRMPRILKRNFVLSEPYFEFRETVVWAGWKPLGWKFGREVDMYTTDKTRRLYILKDFRGEPRQDLHPEVRRIRDLRVALNEEIPAAVWHPDRVERMMERYGEDYDEKSVFVGVGTGLGRK